MYNKEKLAKAGAIEKWDHVDGDYYVKYPNGHDRLHTKDKCNYSLIEQAFQMLENTSKKHNITFNIYFNGTYNCIISSEDTKRIYAYDDDITKAIVKGLENFGTEIKN